MVGWYNNIYFNHILHKRWTNVYSLSQSAGFLGYLDETCNLSRDIIEQNFALCKLRALSCKFCGY